MKFILTLIFVISCVRFIDSNQNVKIDEYPAYCAGEIIYRNDTQISTMESKFPGIIQKKQLLTEPCVVKLKSMDVSDEMIQLIVYEEYIIDKLIVVRGIRSPSLKEIKTKLVGFGIGAGIGIFFTLLFGFCALVITSIAAVLSVAGIFILPYLIMAAVAGAGTLLSGSSYHLQQNVLNTLQNNIIQADLVSYNISQTRGQFNSYLDLPLVLLPPTNSSWTKEEQYCTWKKYVIMELQLNEIHEADFIINHSVLRPELLERFVLNSNLLDNSKTIIFKWRGYFYQAFFDRQQWTWNTIHKYRVKIEQDFRELEQDPLNVKCSQKFK